MDNQRRDFFKNIGGKTAGIAAASVAPTMVHLSAISDDVKKLADSLNQKLILQKAEIGQHLKGLGNRLDSAMATAAYQQAQLTLIFFLLLVSFAIDAGMTLTLASTVV